MEQFKLFINFLRGKSIWIRIAYLVVLAALTLLLTCCGSTTKATIRQPHSGSTTTVSISTNNPTNWQVTPDVSLSNTK